jgi:BON domain
LFVRASRAFLIGVGTAFFFDPRLGRRRRTVARDQALRALRGFAHAIAKKSRFAAGKARGMYAFGHRLVTRPDISTDDSVVEQRIRSEAFRDLDVPASSFDVEVKGGVATVSGPVPDDDVASELVARVRKVTGVEDVTATLRVAGDEATRPRV